MCTEGPPLSPWAMNLFSTRTSLTYTGWGLHGKSMGCPYRRYPLASPPQWRPRSEPTSPPCTPYIRGDGLVAPTNQFLCPYACGGCTCRAVTTHCASHAATRGAARHQTANEKHRRHHPPSPPSLWSLAGVPPPSSSMRPLWVTDHGAVRGIAGGSGEARGGAAAGGSCQPNRTHTPPVPLPTPLPLTPPPSG
jgi:hypothetical protein